MVEILEEKPCLIDIRPDVSVYATYRRLSYRPWYAIAEFVDNSTQNYYDHRNELVEAYKNEGGIPGKLLIEIAYDSEKSSLTISDNANGMNIEELARAVTLDKPPHDRSGRCEFGMGLKTAACWFGKSWEIDTTRLGSDKRYRVVVDVEDLIKSHPNTIKVDEEPAKLSSHFTRITIRGLYKPLKGRTHEKIRDQLGSMYRADLRSKEMDILWSGMPISYEEPPLLKETVPDQDQKIWKKDVSFDVPWEIEGKELKLSVSGWVGIRMPGKQRDAGFVLMRRGRVVLGGPDEGYKPKEIFGQPNSFSHQRLVGELKLDKWPVTQAKDAFDWSGGLEDAFIIELENNCKEYRDKAEAFREKEKNDIKEENRVISSLTQNSLQSNGSHKIIDETEPSLSSTNSKVTQSTFMDYDLGKSNSVQTSPISQKTELPICSANSSNESKKSIKFILGIDGICWNFNVSWQSQSNDANWMAISYGEDNEIKICLNSSHPFFKPYLEKADMLKILHEFVLSLALAEKMSRLTSTNGLIDPADIRTHMNKVLRRATEIEVKKDE